MEITFYGHASIGIKIGETHLLVDPFISENPLASDIDINQIKADYILITTAGQDLGGTFNFPFGSVKMVSALHSSTFENGSDGGAACGFVIKTPDKTVYIAGSTALHFDMQLIPVRYKLDLAVLPIGGNFTMDVEDAIMASDFVKCNKILGYHYNTMSHIKIDKDAAVRSFKAKGKELILLGVGQIVVV